MAHIHAARYMAERIPGARLVEFPGINHMIIFGDLEPLLQMSDGVQRLPDRGSNEIDCAMERALPGSESRCAGA